VQDDNFLLLNEGNIYESYINSESVTESFTLNFTSDNLKSLAAYVSTKKNDLIEYNTNEIVPEFRVIEKLYPHTKRTLGYINSIRNFYKTGESDGDKLFEILHLFLHELISLNKKTSLEIDQISAKKRITREELYKRLHILRDYIQSCYNENISLESLSKICFLNPFYLLREFKRYFNMTPHQYLTQVVCRRQKD
jgi:YesN/AraC family two-component response regulator